jgi:hypothetical protein
MCVCAHAHMHMCAYVHVCVCAHECVHVCIFVPPLAPALLPPPLSPPRKAHAQGPRVMLLESDGGVVMLESENDNIRSEGDDIRE